MFHLPLQSINNIHDIYLINSLNNQGQADFTICSPSSTKFPFFKILVNFIKSMCTYSELNKWLYLYVKDLDFLYFITQSKNWELSMSEEIFLDR